MAPRKTTKTAVADTPKGQADLEKAAEVASTEQIEQDAIEMLGDLTRRQQENERFMVALAVFPTIMAHCTCELVGDENEKGAVARTAFEYADAFIAQSKKGECDAG